MRINEQAPVAVMTVVIRGKVKLRTPAMKDVVSGGSSLVVSAALTESVVDANGPGHSLLTLNRREHLGRVLESDWPLAQRVGDGEEVDESS